MKILPLIFLSLISMTAGAQSIKGKLADPADNKPLRGATLALSPVNDSLAIRQAVSDSSGNFEFNGISVDTYSLRVSYIGYEEFKQVVMLSDSMLNLDLKTIYVPKGSLQLGGVTVVSKAAPVVQKGDTTQFSAGQFKVNPDATTEDLIKKMPGITVDRDGTVTAQGEQVRKVTIDGKDFFGDDASAALRNLPSEIVDKIQVFDRLSDQAQFTGVDDGNAVKALNIVTKSGLRNGQFGRIYGGIGSDGRYTAGGNVSTFSGDRRISVVGNFNNINQQNFGSQDLLGVTSTGGGNRGGGNRGGNRGGGRPGGGNFGGGENFQVGQQSGISKTNAFGLNYADKWGKKVDVSGSYFFNQSNNANQNATLTEILGEDYFTDQRSLSGSVNYNHRINMRLEYKIDSNNSIIVNPSLNFQRNTSLSESFEHSRYGTTDTTNTSESNRNVLRNGYNLRNNILYRHNFAKRGRTFSVGLNTTMNKNNGKTYSLSRYRFFRDTGITDSLQNQYTDNPTNGYNLSANLVYTEPLSAKSQLQFNYSPSYSKSEADQQAFLYDDFGGKYSEFIPVLSNKFDNSTTTQNGGITYRLGNSRDNQFAMGVSVQHSTLESDRIYPTSTNIHQSFTNILPNLMWSKKIAPRSNIRVFYRASTNFPGVTQLQDVVNQNNQLRMSVGNPSLSQSYNHLLSGRYTFTNTQKGQSFFANIFLQAQQDYITNATYIASADSIIQFGSPNVVLQKGAQLVKPLNLDGYKSLRSFFTFSQPVSFIKSNVNLSTGFSFSRLPGFINNSQGFTNNYTYTGGLVIASNISEYIDFNLSYNVNFNNAKSTLDMGDNQYINQAAGFQTNFLSKTGWFLQSDITNQTFTGLSDEFNQSYWLWNAGIGKKFLRNKAAELKLSVFDLLKQNQSISRVVDGNFIEDSQSQVLQQYFMLTFTYNLKNFGTARSMRGNQRR